MADQLQLRGGTTTEHATFTGALREVTVDTDKDTVVVHDNATAGGHPLLREDLSNLPAGTIDDADVSASAAIAGTKISPNFGSQNVVTTGTSTAASLIPTGSSVPTNGVYLPAANSVGISTNSVQRVFIDGNATVFRHSQPELGLGSGRPFVQLHGNLGSSQFASYAAYNWVNSGQDAAFNLYKSRSGTIGTNALVSNGDSLGRIGFHGDTGAEFVGGADIISQVDGVPSGTSMPGRLLLRTTPSGSTVPTERVRITSDGRLGLGTSSPGSLLTLGTATPILEFNDSDSATNNKRWMFATGATSLTISARTDAGAGGGNFFNFNRSNQQIQSFQGFQNGVPWFHVDNSTARLGIGTTSPNESLEVAGNIHVSGADRSIFNRSNNALAFGTNNTERARIDSAGRLLVGTSSTSVTSTLLLQGNSTNSTAAASLIIARGANNPGNGDAIGSVDFADSSHGLATRIVSRRDGGTWTSGSSQPTRLEFSTTADGASSPTERMRITNTGSLLFNHTDNANLPGNGNTNTGATFEFTAGGPTLFISRDGLSLMTNRNSDGGLFSIRRSGAQVGSITVTAASTAYNTTSDYRLKENVVPLSGAIDRLQQIPVYRFNFIADPDTVVDGFIAHEAQAVVPECVTGTKDEVDADGNPVYQGIDQSKLVPLLTAALQEALAKIEDLEARLDAANL